MTSKTTIIFCAVLMIMAIGGVVMATNCELMPVTMGGWSL